MSMTEQQENLTSDDNQTNENEKLVFKLVLKYFFPIDAEGYRMCRACERVPRGQRSGSAGRVKVFIDTMYL